jgi:hypothetical protein
MDPLTIGILAGLVLNTVGNVGNGIANYKNSAKADRALYAVDSIRTQIKENNASVEEDINTIKDAVNSTRADLDNAWNNINHLRYQNPQPQQQPQQIIQPPVQQQVAQPQQSIQQQLQPTQFDELIEVLKQTNKNIGDLKSEVLDLKQQGK